MKLMRKKLFGTLMLSLLVWAGVQAQDGGDKPSLTKGNLGQQFDYITEEANNFKNYKVVKSEWLNILKKNTLDSVARLEKERNSALEIGKTQKAEIEALKKELNDTNAQLTRISEEKDSISFFGIQINKPAYKSIMWGIIAILSLILGFFIYKFRNANAITQLARQNLADLELEYEDHRRKALEREQKARRELQDEINKHKMSKSK